MAFELNNIPRNYCLHMFYKYANRPKKTGDSYIGGCPICREGKSWGRKQRACYFPNENYFYCHNENIGFSAYQWIKEVTGWDYQHILEDVIQFSGKDFLERVEMEQFHVSTHEQPPIPPDSIDLSDSQQVEYYNDNTNVQRAVQYIKHRRLDTATYRCDKYFISLNDPIHRNRLIIPFTNNGKIDFYLSRAISDDDQRPKYLGKFGHKPVFNIKKIDSSIPFYFAFEGPIDSMFVRNAVACSGVVLTQQQRNQLACYDLMLKRIWVLDNQRLDATSREKSLELAETGDLVFVWPYALRNFKDVNELAQKTGKDEVPYRLFIDNALSGDALRLAL